MTKHNSRLASTVTSNYFELSVFCWGWRFNNIKLQNSTQNRLHCQIICNEKIVSLLAQHITNTETKLPFLTILISNGMHSIQEKPEQFSNEWAYATMADIYEKGENNRTNNIRQHSNNQTEKK